MTRPRLGGCDFEPRVTVDDGSGDSKVVIFFARLFFSLPFCLPGFYLFPSVSLKRTLNYSFGEAAYVVLVVLRRLLPLGLLLIISSSGTPGPHSGSIMAFVITLRLK